MTVSVKDLNLSQFNNYQQVREAAKQHYLAEDPEPIEPAIRMLARPKVIEFADKARRIWVEVAKSYGDKAVIKIGQTNQDEVFHEITLDELTALKAEIERAISDYTIYSDDLKALADYREAVNTRNKAAQDFSYAAERAWNEQQQADDPDEDDIEDDDEDEDEDED